MEKKTCKNCGLEKPFNEFGKQKNGKFGLRANCNVCHRKLNQEYYEANKTKVAERNTAWQKDDKNKEAIRLIRKNGLRCYRHKKIVVPYVMCLVKRLIFSQQTTTTLLVKLEDCYVKIVTLY